MQTRIWCSNPFTVPNHQAFQFRVIPKLCMADNFSAYPFFHFVADVSLPIMFYGVIALTCILPFLCPWQWKKVGEAEQCQPWMCPLSTGNAHLGSITQWKLRFCNCSSTLKVLTSVWDTEAPQPAEYMDIYFKVFTGSSDGLRAAGTPPLISWTRLTPSHFIILRHFYSCVSFDPDQVECRDGFSTGPMESRVCLFVEGSSCQNL